MSRQSPESERYDELKGHPVCVEFSKNDVVPGVLRWVDRYTVGLYCPVRKQVLIVNKSSFRNLYEAPNAANPATDPPDHTR